jgi:undecaprenyl diphosphate synthase
MLHHIAIIMDGNGRWAEARGLPRTKGHEAGSQQISVVAKAAGELGVKVLTLYAFSTENWKRPISEVNFLMGLISRYSDEKLPEMMENGIRLRTIGRISALPAAARRSVEKTVAATANNNRITLNLALNYGGRAEIVDAVNSMLKNNPKLSKVTEEDLRWHLYAPDLPDPDLLIRTGGEFRVSNFLLWQISYTELYVSDVCWPDFGADELRKAAEAFARRQRRFGGLGDR